MITTKRPFRPASNLWAFSALVPTADGPVSEVMWVYGLLASIFLAAQVVGFIVSQTYYSEKVEEIKFDVLREEEKEWKE